MEAVPLSFVALTDGESSPLYYYNDNGIPANSYYDNIIVRNKRGEMTQLTPGDSCTGSIIKMFSDQMPDVTFTNIFLGGKHACATYLRHFEATLNDKIYSSDNSFVATTDKFWPMIAVINPRSFGQSPDEIEINEGASKAQIKAAFKKYLKGRTNNRRLLSSLAGQFS